MADNVTVGGITFKSKELAAAVHLLMQGLADQAGADAVGLVAANPDPLTILGRLKAIADAVGAQGPFVDGLEGLATTNNTLATALNGYVDGVEALLTTLGANTDTLEALTAANTAAINALATPDYEPVAAASADTILGAAGAAGDLLASITFTPLTLSPGAVTLKDGAGGAAITLFAGGANSLSTLHPFTVPLGMVAGTRWILTTGANISAVAVGNFT